MKNLKQKKAFTLVEVALALTIFSVVAAGVTWIVVRLSKAVVSEEQKLESVSEKLFLDQVMAADLSRSAPSLNFLMLMDNAGKEFFSALRDARCLTDCSRNIKLSNDADQFVLLLSDKEDPVPRVLEPTAAFDAAPPSFANVGSAGGTLTFNATKLRTALSTLWVPGQVLMFYSPIGERPTSGPSVDMSKASKNISFVAMVPASGDNLVILDQSAVPWNNKMPFDSSKSISVPQDFFLNLPSSGGASAIAFVRPVEFVRYRIVARPETKLVNGKTAQSVVREILSMKSGLLEWGESWNIGDRIAEVEFFRNDISAPSISVRFKEQK